jgi:hypothetical protein
MADSPLKQQFLDPNHHDSYDANPAVPGLSIADWGVNNKSGQIPPDMLKLLMGLLGGQNPQTPGTQPNAAGPAGPMTPQSGMNPLAGMR